MDKKLKSESLNETPASKETAEILKEQIQENEKISETRSQELLNLKEIIAKEDLSDDLKKEAKIQAEKIKPLDENRKVQNLLEIAEKKGIVYAVKVAEKMDDPYALDALHDLLVQRGYHKKFMKRV